MDEQEAVTKKLEELRKQIPLIERYINATQGNPDFKVQHDKLVCLKYTLISGRFVSNVKIILKNSNGLISNRTVDFHPCCILLY